MNERKALKECALYFKGKKGFGRAFEQMIKKAVSYGRASGRIQIALDNPTSEEREQLSGFLGESFEDGKISFTMGKFAEALSRTKYSGIALWDLLEEYRGRPLVSRRDELALEKQRIKDRREHRLELLRGAAEADYPKRSQARSVVPVPSVNPVSSVNPSIPGGDDSAESDTFRWLCARAEDSSDSWIDRLSEEELLGLLKAEQIMNGALVMPPHIRSAAGRRANERSAVADGAPGVMPVRLAILAMEAMCDPHAFDRSRLCGRAFIDYLFFVYGAGTGASRASALKAEEINELYYLAGIRADDISSFVTIFGIRLFEGGREHEAYRAFADRHESALVSLANLNGVDAVRPAAQRVLIVENQMVFSELCSRCPDASIVCTSGQLKTAALILIDMLCECDCEIAYCGDLDPEGMDIADRLIVRSGQTLEGRIKLIGMGADDYRRSLSNVKLSPKRLKILDHIKSPALSEAAALMRETGMAGYQESVVEDLVRYLG